MLDKVQDLLVKTKIFDKDGTLSLSNLVIMLALAYIGEKDLCAESLTALAMGLINYNLKKFFRLKMTEPERMRPETENDRPSLPQ